MSLENVFLHLLVHLTQGDHDGRAMIVSWRDVKPAKKKSHGSTSLTDTMTTFLVFFTTPPLKDSSMILSTSMRLVPINPLDSFTLRTPPMVGPDVPYTFGIIGDLGQTLCFKRDIVPLHVEP
ncbi:Purple acid phosphatase 6 [Raphanus sativus]|nr:Purple acid phosphatase 6 [Raphanus sativus]